MIVDYKMASQTGMRYPSGYVEHNFMQRPDEEPVSRTYQYRKVMKPMLERKRRARINRCLDELKELMVSALQAEGENVAKLEKADILELTVRHLHSLRRQGRLVVGPEGSYAEKFKAGFTHCATEVSQFIANATVASAKRQGPAEAQAGARLLQHLSSCIRRLESAPYSSHPPVVPVQRSSTALRSPNQSVNQQEDRGKVPQRIAVAPVGGRTYAPPSPPASPAPTGEGVMHAHMWRPW